jgi:hypothetical protein
MSFGRVLVIPLIPILLLMIEYKNYDRQRGRETEEGWKKGPEDHDYYISLAPPILH